MGLISHISGLINAQQGVSDHYSLKPKILSFFMKFLDFLIFALCWCGFETNMGIC